MNPAGRRSAGRSPRSGLSPASVRVPKVPVRREASPAARAANGGWHCARPTGTRAPGPSSRPASARGSPPADTPPPPAMLGWPRRWRNSNATLACPSRSGHHWPTCRNPRAACSVYSRDAAAAKSVPLANHRPAPSPEGERASPATSRPDVLAVLGRPASLILPVAVPLLPRRRRRRPTAASSPCLRISTHARQIMRT